MKPRISNIVASIQVAGAHRVITNAAGDAIPGGKAAGLGYRSDIIFVRDDGWSLGSSKAFESIAYNMWADSWIGFMRTPDYEFHSIEEYK